MLQRLICRLFGHVLQYTGASSYTFVCQRCCYSTVDGYRKG